MIHQDICELVHYGIGHNLVDSADRVYVTNRLLELFGLDAYEEVALSEKEVRPLHCILESMTEYAVEKGILEEATTTTRDLFDTKIMGLLTPPPSVVRSIFTGKYEKSPEQATDYFYALSKDTNYIRCDRIVKDEKWETDTPYGTIDITINLSKPEKDPRDIAKAGQAKASGYPKCLLCKENEGYGGHLSHPARQNHRIIPMTLCGENYFMQYSPYVYYNEHCIIFNEQHIPMKINKNTFEKLLEFVSKFPHYMIGSNADLPIVGGSILSHDHFQGGSYEFAMAKAPYETMFSMEKFKSVTAGIVKWPMSVIRLQSENMQELADASDYILNCWKNYTDESVYIFSHTEDKPHNTITPIARKRGEVFEMDLVLRNNITTKECPMGLYHPHQQYYNIKKENIGLIEVMGLAILPARLKQEMVELEEAILQGKDIRKIDSIEKHADWIETFIKEYEITAENIHSILQDEIGKTFARILECAGVFKRDEEGKNAFMRFIAVVSN